MDKTKKWYLEEWRRARRLSVNALSRLSLITRQTITLIEAGKSMPHRQTIQTLAIALQCSVHDLEGPPPKGIGPIRESMKHVG